MWEKGTVRGSRMLKVCRQCRNELDLSCFSKNKSRKDGRSAECRDCVKAYLAEYREKNIDTLRQKYRDHAAKNREAARAKTRAWVAANPDRKRAMDAQYRKNNAEKVAARDRAWREANPERVRATKTKYLQRHREALLGTRRSRYRNNEGGMRDTNRGWAAANKDRRAASNSARKARKRMAQPAWADLDVIRELYELSARMFEETGIRHQVDHIVPLRSKYVCGLHCEFNLQVMPAKENLRKRNFFRPGVDGLEEPWHEREVDTIFSHPIDGAVN